MQVVFISNYYNHHQKALCGAFDRCLNGSFLFIETERMEQERLALGWGETETPSFVWRSYESRDAAQRCQEAVDNADVVIYGCGPFEMIQKRLHNKKLTLWYSERIHKQSDGAAYKWILRRIRYWWEFGRFSEFYLLCASAYAAWDFVRAGVFQNKAFRWGYFPETRHYDDVSKLIGQKTPHSILWAGRLIDWKHPEKAVLVAERLVKEEIPFHLTMVGTGEMETQLGEIIRSKGLEAHITMTGAIPAAEVRGYMEKSQIYLFTSDRNEGWGAVMNEAMNSGCAVVASHSIGAAPYLGKHGKNCLLYRDGDFEDLYQKTRLLMADAQQRARLGMAAYQTIAEVWNADVAAERLVNTCRELLSGRVCYGQEGPCSQAEVLPDNWFYTNSWLKTLKNNRG